MEEDLNKIKPAMGGDYLLHEGNDIFRCFRGIYLGRIKEKTPWHLQPKNPEGHLFLRLNESKEIQMYNVRTGDNSGSSIKFYWFSDGYDDPSWPAGICVSELDFKINESEREYLLNLLNKKLKERDRA